jgi:hypothetical protein
VVSLPSSFSLLVAVMFGISILYVPLMVSTIFLFSSYVHSTYIYTYIHTYVHTYTHKQTWAMYFSSKATLLSFLYLSTSRLTRTIIGLSECFSFNVSFVLPFSSFFRFDMFIHLSFFKWSYFFFQMLLLNYGTDRTSLHYVLHFYIYPSTTPFRRLDSHLTWGFCCFPFEVLHDFKLLDQFFNYRFNDPDFPSVLYLSFMVSFLNVSFLVLFLDLYWLIHISFLVSSSPFLYV